MITSTSNARIKWVRALQSRKKVRLQERAFVLEGERLAQEALDCGTPARLLLHTDRLTLRQPGLLEEFARQGTHLEQVSEAVMKACSSTESPPGLLLVMPMAERRAPVNPTLVLVADGMRDPGNLGTLMRTALAAEVELLYLTEGCVEAYNPKVVRGAMGAHLRLPILEIRRKHLAEALKGLQIYLAAAGEGSVYHQIDWSKPSALVIGAETEGISRQLQDLPAEHVQIPMPGPMESLNAAISAAVILFEIARQRGAA